ncbi:hypothetical protein NKR19_g4257 [Coniochaeta hoffmannii]|uniref:Uncharacterized protein n=1 Tax=Coniochaeta hoffmannii TaxID=91930 RepID=A0AA38VWM3_9PEZI|nr:hypothetical protein NKR19_g4257 [Coniochaeta hoffmannii]
MEQNTASDGAEIFNAPSERPAVTRKRSTSGAGGLLSKFPFMRSSSDHHRPRSRASIDEPSPQEVPSPVSPTRGAPTSMSNALQQQQDTRPQSIDVEPKLTSPKSPTISYFSTDDEDALHMSGGLRPGTPSLPRPDRSSMSSGSDSYFSGRRRSATTQRAKSPLALTSLAGLSTTPLPQQEADWDYSETEWWGWVVLVVTWVVFVVGMGSCLGVWSWAWDVGTTPYAPPELEDDPTLPIVGYYPALIILTGVMAWVWVVVAWVGMKYFRHARVSGD